MARIHQQTFLLTMLLTVLVGLGCAGILVVGLFADPSRYSTLALALAGVGVVDTIVAGWLSVRARRDGTWPLLLGSLAGVVVWGALIAVVVRT